MLKRYAEKPNVLLTLRATLTQPSRFYELAIKNLSECIFYFYFWIWILMLYKFCPKIPVPQNATVYRSAISIIFKWDENLTEVIQSPPTLAHSNF